MKRRRKSRFSICRTFIRIDAQYNPYDIGVMGELDVRILSELFGEKNCRGTDAGLGRRNLLRRAEKDAPTRIDRIGCPFLSFQWKSEEAAADFVKMYADELGRKYTPGFAQHFSGNQPERAGLRYQ